MLGAFNETLVNNPSPTALRGASRRNVGPPPLGGRIKGTGMRKEVSSHDGSNQWKKRIWESEVEVVGWQKKGHGRARGRGPVMGIWVFSLLRIYAYMTESPPVSRIKHVHDQSPQGRYVTKTRCEPWVQLHHCITSFEYTKIISP